MPTQDELVLQQFASARKNLQQQKAAAQDELKQGLNRQTALTGLSGGRAMKAQGKAQKTLEEGFAGAGASLDTEQARAMQNVQAQKEQQEFAKGEREASQAFGREERVGSQEFGASESERGRQFASGERQQAQAFQSAENAIGRSFTSGEREAVQAFQGLQAQLGREFATGERLGSEDFARLEAETGRQFTTEERQAIQEFQNAQQLQQQEFATGERLGSQQFAGGESELQRMFAAAQSSLDRGEQARQFDQSYGLQRDQFRENKEQFYQQLEYQMYEFRENQRTNILNAMTALQSAGFKNQDDFNRFRDMLRGFNA